MQEKIGTRRKCRIWHFYCKKNFANCVVLVIVLIIPQRTESPLCVWNKEPEPPRALDPPVPRKACGRWP